MRLKFGQILILIFFLFIRLLLWLFILTLNLFLNNFYGFWFCVKEYSFCILICPWESIKNKSPVLAVIVIKSCLYEFAKIWIRIPFMFALFLPNFKFLNNLKIWIHFSNIVQKILNFNMRNVVLFWKLLSKMRFSGKRRTCDENFNWLEIVLLTKFLFYDLIIFSKTLFAMPGEVCWLGVFCWFICHH